MKFALAGNPNSGKTTLFNALTGSTAHVGNWPGVTVDKKVGTYKKLDEAIEIVDLPGIYSLSPYTPEETVSRNFLLENPACIINIVDATNLERNLYLTTQLMELNTPIVIALNMMDLIKKNGDKIDISKLEKAIGLPIVEVSALRGEGIDKLMRVAYAESLKSRKGFSVLAKSYIGELYNKTYNLYADEKVDNAVFHAVKLIENDEIEIERSKKFTNMVNDFKKGIDTGIFKGDFEGIVADLRYKYISKHFSPLHIRAMTKDGMSRSYKIDKVLTHKIFGIPLFFMIMFFVFHLTFSSDLLFLSNVIPEGSFESVIFGTDAINSPGTVLFNCVEWLSNTISVAVRNTMPEGTWYTSLVCDGLLQGLFAVLSFIPQIMCIFFFLSILEDTGYMARVAFIMDRAFRNFGLSGRAFMPLLMCFGCAVPGIMATRTIGSESERKRTIILTPFFSCGAKLPIWAAFAGVFAHTYKGLNAEVIVFSIYLIGIIVAVMSAFILKKTTIKGDAAPFIMELPDYHWPQPKGLVIHLWDKLKHYLYKAATVIAGAIVVIWFLSSFNFRFHMVENSGDSIIGLIAKAFTWLFIPLGFGMGENGWQFVVASFTGLIAKEMVIATMGTFSGMDGDSVLDLNGGEMANSPIGAMMLGIGGMLGNINISIPAMFSFMAFNLLSIPCVAAVAAANGELNSKKSMWGAIAYWMSTAYIVSLIVFWVGVFATICWWGALLAIVAVIAIIIMLIILSHKKEKQVLASNLGGK